ncbi:MAG: TonB-dependent receptor [Prolixibacteraceae bacterium]|nr:TonB-dependent receptor [Prolixibacteraceae bacterium]
MKIFQQYFLLTVLVITINTVSAQDKTANPAGHETLHDSITMNEEVEEITVTAFRRPYNLYTTPAPLNLVRSAQLEAGSGLSSVEALNQVPGIYMHNGTLNTNRLTIRGIGSRTPYGTNKIKSYYGEIPLTTGDGETTLEDLEPIAVKRAEIIKGPASSLFGAGLGGTIIFYPANVSDNFVQSQSTFASFGTIKNSLSAGIINNNLNIFLLGSFLESDGFRQNNNTVKKNLLISSAYNLSESINLTLLLKATKLKAFIPSSLDYQTFNNSPEAAAANWNSIRGYEDYLTGQLGFGLDIKAGADKKISLATFGSTRNADELRPFNRLIENSNYTGFRGNFQKTYSTNNAELTLITGLEIFREWYKWSTVSNQTGKELLSDNLERRSYENFFLQFESNFNDKLFISSGINGNLTRFIYNDKFLTDENRSGRHRYNPVISPRIGMSYALSPSISFFGNISHGFSTPTFEETLLPQGNINTEIKPESGWNNELGVRVHSGDRLQGSVSYYRIYINNLLVARRTGEDAYMGVNAGRSLHPGFEAEIRWSVLNPATLPSLTLNGNITLANYHFQEFTDNDVNYSGNILPGTPNTTWLTSVHFRPAKIFQFTAWYRHTGKMYVNDSNTDFSKPFGITNFESEFTVKSKLATIEIKSGIQNIFNIHYSSMLAINAPAFGGNQPRYYYPGYPRNYFLSINFKL